MAQIDVAGLAGCQGLRPVGARPIRHLSLCDIPASPAGARKRAMSMCDPTRIRVGASRVPTSENRNSISRARPRDLTFARHVEKSFGSPPSGGKLVSICQPSSPGSLGCGKRTRNVPPNPGGDPRRQRPSDGSMTAGGLRREAARGRLVIERTAGKDYTTLAAIEEMRQLCRVVPKVRVCGSDLRGATLPGSSPTPQDISSSTADAKSLEHLNSLKPRNRLQSTSTKNTERAATRLRPIEQIPVSDVIAIYARDVAPEHSDPKETSRRLSRLLKFFGNRSLAEINGALCREYLRQANSISVAARDLTDSRSAINHHRREGLHDRIVAVITPPQTRPCERWLERSEAAALLWAAWRRPRCKHIAKFILLALYTGRRCAVVSSASSRKTTHGSTYGRASYARRKAPKSQKSETRRYHYRRRS
jgi:hypothetical protein